MLLKGIFLAMILNIQIVYSLNIKNLLFKSQLTGESTATSPNISSGELEEGKPFFFKVTPPDFSSSKTSARIKDSEHNLVLFIKILIISNSIIVLVVLVVILWKLFHFTRLKILKRRELSKKKKRKNIVNNPHSSFFEDF